MSELYDMLHDDGDSVNLEESSSTVMDTESNSVPETCQETESPSEKLKKIVQRRDPDGYTLLHLAVIIQDYELVEELLKAGADPLAQNDICQNKTPFDLSLQSSYPKEIRHLLWKYIKDSCS